MLKGKIALITGASRGIGNEVARVFLENGATVIVNYRENLGKIEELKNEFNDLVFPIKGDVSKSEDVKQMFSKIREKFSSLDILVNNAGILKDNLLIMIREEEWDSLINTNLKGSFLCMQQAAKTMIKNGGSIINISSIVGVEGNSGQCAYSASKAGLIGLTKSAAKELGQFGIRVNAIAPGLIKTDMIEHLKDEIVKESIRDTALKRIGTPQDVAKTALFLASDQSEFVTGEIISVDGGWAI